MNKNNEWLNTEKYNLRHKLTVLNIIVKKIKQQIKFATANINKMMKKKTVLINNFCLRRKT